MKPLYIKSGVNNLAERPLNADEFQQIRNYQYLYFNSPEDLLKEYQKQAPDKIERAYFISKILKGMPINTLISFGAGESVIEYIIKKQCSNIEISISDFDGVLLEHLEQVYKNIFSAYYRFDISKDTFDVLKIKKGHYQMAFINAVLYVLNDNEVKIFFKNLANLKIEYLLIVSLAHLELRNEIKREIIGILKRILRKNTDDGDGGNTFWGWGRYKHEILSLAKSSGYRLVKYIRWTGKNNKGLAGVYIFKLNRLNGKKL